MMYNTTMPLIEHQNHLDTPTMLSSCLCYTTPPYHTFGTLWVIPISCKNDYFPDFLFLRIPLFFCISLWSLCPLWPTTFYFLSDIGIIPISCKNDYFSGFLFLCIPLFFAFLCGLCALCGQQSSTS